MKVYLILIVCITQSIKAEDECFAPQELKLKEEYCWTEQIEVVDRIVQRSKNVLNFAKKKLGMEVEEENTKQKCEYYLCILRQLHMLNANDYPSYENILQWTKKNVAYNQALNLMEQLDKCNGALINSTVRETRFYADQIEDKQNTSDSSQNEPKVVQNSCEIASEFIDCLSRQKRCAVFHYP